MGEREHDAATNALLWSSIRRFYRGARRHLDPAGPVAARRVSDDGPDRIESHGHHPTHVSTIGMTTPSVSRHRGPLLGECHYDLALGAETVEKVLRMGCRILRNLRSVSAASLGKLLYVPDELFQIVAPLLGANFAEMETDLGRCSNAAVQNIAKVVGVTTERTGCIEVQFENAALSAANGPDYLLSLEAERVFARVRELVRRD
jgi:hypothetical protein